MWKQRYNWVKCAVEIILYRLIGVWPLTLERGDADGSGTSLRLMGVIALVLAVVAILGSSAFSVANSALNQLGSR